MRAGHLLAQRVRLTVKDRAVDVRAIKVGLSLAATER